MNQFVNNFTQMVFLPEPHEAPGLGARKIPKIIFTHIANDHPTVICLLAV